MNTIVFEDDGVEKLFPISTGRPAYAISCAGFRLIDWLQKLTRPPIGLVRDYLERIQILDFPELSGELELNDEWTLVLNARVAPTASNYAAISKLTESQPACPVVARSDWAIAWALVPTKTFSSVPRDKWLATIESLPNLKEVETSESDLALFDFPHDVVAQNMSAFDENVKAILAGGKFEEIRPGVYVGEDVKMDESVVMDTGPGPIVIESGTKVGPFSYFRGPVYIGPNSKVSEHASIKDAVSISHTCKIGGEVEGTVFEAYSNKQHHGFLGHSYVGSWVNLGAGTCNSDLKNTYGKVNVVYRDGKTPSGMQFMGCVIGDYAKTAINTSIFTGKLIGTAAMVYGFATTNVPSFTNYARTFEKVGELPPEVVVTTQKRMFQRRKVEQRPCDIQLVNDMFRVTEHERPDDLSREPISL